ncbi:MAG: hypothetical protein AUI91_14935 [Acidobacteria bacterium 13_1_40CM_3_56_11]|nr:MAG: hypothetical protein AUH28_21305 [Acidobacteria bacterium 13_1_40CM_56_16]OLD16046.1 MAG: hypothetical protein AUI91_14935 [Acidobacteria bacterium 13_1_40CM_3_56_11]OLD69676.1 MAG: hypothetical protein AUI45_07000 [Acidobacteria bacterium 13_1_40CM_2_56_11]
MAIDDYVVNAAWHVAAGFTLSMLDYLRGRKVYNKDARIEDQRSCLQSINLILDSEMVPAADPSGETKPVLNKDSLQYAVNIAEARRYFARNDLIPADSVIQNIKNYLKGLRRGEFINPLSPWNKFFLAIGLEVIYDTLLGRSSYRDAGQSPLVAFAYNIYQIPAFWAGLMLGSGIRWLVNFVSTPSEERKLTKEIQRRVRGTNILDIVQNYEPSEDIEKQLSLKGVSFASITAPMSEGVRYLIDEISGYSAKKEAARNQERERIRNSFKDLTKGR